MYVYGTTYRTLKTAYYTVHCTLYTVYTVQYRAGYSTQHFINIFTVYKYKYDTVRYVQYHTV